LPQFSADRFIGWLVAAAEMAEGWRRRRSTPGGTMQGDGKIAASRSAAGRLRVVLSQIRQDNKKPGRTAGPLIFETRC
jgi:hypothetical protein